MVITLAAFEALATATVMPAARDDLGGTALYGWAFSAFMLTSLVGITFAGQQADRYGPARPFAIGLAFFAVGLLVAGVAPTMPVLVLGRALQGLGAGVIPPVAYLAVGRGFSEADRPRIFALFASAWVVPGLVGPGIAGAVAEFATWRLVFVGLLPLVPLAFVLVLPSLRSLPVPSRGVAAPPSRLPRAMVLAGGAALLLTGLTLRSWLFTPPLVAAGLVAAVPALRALLPAGTFRAQRGLPSAVLGIGALNMCFFGAEAFVPFMLTEVRGQSTLVAGAVLTSATLSWTAGTWVVDRRAGRWGRGAMVEGGQALVVVGVVLLIGVLWQAWPVALAVPGWGIAGFGMGLAYPNYSLITLSAAPAEQLGTVTAATKLSESLSVAIGTGVAGALVAAGDAGGFTASSLALCFALMATVGVAGLALARRLPSERVGARGPLAAAEGVST